MKSTKRQERFLLTLPVLLFLSTAAVFTFSSRWMGKELGYIIGFIFYWLFWCILIPLMILKKEGMSSLFREKKPLFSKSNWLQASILILIVIITVIMYPPTRLVSTPLRLFIIVVPVAILNGYCEEMLWRGLYVKAYPNNIWLGMVLPAFGFAFWHISPQLVFPASTGIWPFVLSTFFLGISYGWISYRTGSIKWNVLAHSLGGILDFGGAIAPSIIILLHW